MLLAEFGKAIEQPSQHPRQHQQPITSNSPAMRQQPTTNTFLSSDPQLAPPPPAIHHQQLTTTSTTSTTRTTNTTSTISNPPATRQQPTHQYSSHQRPTLASAYPPLAIYHQQSTISDSPILTPAATSQ